MGMLKPDFYYGTVFDIPYDELWLNEIRGLIFDLDNTLAPYADNQPSAKVVALIKRLQRMGFKVCLLTNNTNKRLERFSKPLGIPGIANAAKPLLRGVRKSMQEMGTKRGYTAIIGDQLFSDVWAGKRARLTTVLVNPLSNKDLFLVRFRRMLESWLLNRYYGDARPSANVNLK